MITMGDFGSVAEALAVVERCSQLRSLEDVVRYAVSLSPRPISRAAAVEQLAEEHEGSYTPLRVLPDTTSPLELAQAYLEATAPLLPVIDSFVNAALDIHRAHCSGQGLYLFLRDALCFWPAIQHHRELGNHVDVRFVAYSRRQAKRRENLRVVHNPKNGVLVDAPSDTRIEDGLSLDVGLYGTLVETLTKTGQLDPRARTLFMCSRNPYIAGWVNTSGRDSDEIVRIADTIESLFKPFRWVDGGVELTESTALVCALAFQWSLARFAQEQRGQWNLARALASLDEARASGRNIWFLHQAIPTWGGASAFVEGWSLGRVSYPEIPVQ